ncbi:ATP-grasp domain-containing protein [Dactylosporangium sp. NPDC049525]|uniref:ATP-grasp domain-containing protein n=1 Tax=Dactylosporangium sp. NPDC049525 TaxID=3154730 RepID=UPI00342C86CB
MTVATAGRGGGAELPRLAVLLDFGAASPLSILAAARGLADVVFLCDRSLSYVASRFDELSVLAATYDITGRTAQELEDVVDRAGLAGITTFSESQLNRTAALAHGRGWAFLTPEAARAATDKYLQRRLLAEAGVQATRCRAVRQVADLAAALAEVGLPAVLKPRSGAAGARTCRVTSHADAAARLRDFLSGPGMSGREFVVEEILAGDPSAAGPGWGDYVSVESITHRGVTRHVEITGKFPLAAPFRETGYVVPSTLSESDRRRVLDLTSAALAALGVRDGATHVEVKLTPAGPRVIEVNGRVGGYVADLIRRARGFDLIRAALLVALDRDDDQPAGAYRRHTFQYFLTPPMEAAAVRRFDGVEELDRHHGVTVETFKQVGDALDWRDGTLTYLGIVHGSGRDHRDVLDLVDRVNRTLRIEYVAAGAAPVRQRTGIVDATVNYTE